MAAPPPNQPFQSNYPRAQASSTYVRPPGVYFDSIGIAFDMLRSDWGVYAASALISGIFISAVEWGVFGTMFGAIIAGGIPTRQSPLSPLPILGGLVIQAVLSFFVLALVGIGVRHALGNWPTIADLFLPFKRFGRTMLGVAVLVIPNFLIGLLVALVLPRSNTVASPAAMGYLGQSVGINLVFQFLFMGPIHLTAVAIAFSELAPIDAARQALTGLGVGRSLALSGLLVLSAILGVLGLLACCIGILVTAPIFTNVVALHYVYFFPPDQWRPAPAEYAGRY